MRERYCIAYDIAEGDDMSYEVIYKLTEQGYEVVSIIKKGINNRKNEQRTE